MCSLTEAPRYLRSRVRCCRTEDDGDPAAGRNVDSESRAAMGTTRVFVLSNMVNGGAEEMGRALIKPGRDRTETASFPRLRPVKTKQ